MVWYICKVSSDNTSNESLFKNVLITDFFLTKPSSHSQFGNCFFQLMSKFQLPCIVLEMICYCKIQKSLSSLQLSEFYSYILESFIFQIAQSLKQVEMLLILSWSVEYPTPWLKKQGIVCTQNWQGICSQRYKTCGCMLRKDWQWLKWSHQNLSVESYRCISILKCFLYALSMYED